MGHVGDKLLPHLIDLDLFINILLQLIVGLFQLCDGFLQPVGHLIHVASQNADLVLLLPGVLHIEVQIGHLLGQLCQIHNGQSDLPNHQIDDQTSQNHDNTSHNQQKTVGEIYALPHAGERNGHDKQGGIVRKESPCLQIC